jgi:hypothetical protein
MTKAYSVYCLQMWWQLGENATGTIPLVFILVADPIGSKARDHWMNSPSSGRIQLTIRL